MRREYKILLTFMGLVIIILGFLCNNFVMAQNDGKMPVKNMIKENPYPILLALHQNVTNQTKYYYLADIIGKSDSVIFSIGDLIMFLGIIPFMFGLFAKEDGGVK